MSVFLKHFLLPASVLLLFGSCHSAYKGITSTGSPNCIQLHKPHFSRTLYNTHVDVVGKQLSGLLIIKQMPDSSIRMVFTNEAGFKFFDFGFSQGGFTVYYMMEQMNKKAVIKTLQKDFELVLMRHTQYTPTIFRKDNEWYYQYKNGKDNYYYITDSTCSELTRMERGSKRKKITEAYLGNFINNMPDSIGIKHFNFNFTIALKQINEHVAE